MLPKVLRDQSKPKLILAAIVVFGILYVALYNPYDDKYMAEVEDELKLARLICENSTNWVLANTESLKLDNNILKNIKVKDKDVELRHVK